MSRVWMLLSDLEPAFTAVAGRGLGWMLVVALSLFCLRRMSAAVRHWIGFCGMAGLLLVTVLGVAGVRWEVASPVAEAGKVTVTVVRAMNPMIIAPGSAEVFDSGIGVTSVGPAEEGLPGSLTVAPDLTESVSPKRKASAQSPQALPWLMMLWVLGALFFGARLIHSAWLLRKLRLRGSCAAPAAVESLALSLQEQLGIKASVNVRLADCPVAPMAVGIFHRCILLPSTAATDWSESRLRAVLLHELSHLRRRDILTGAIGMVGAGVHWFNPLVWLVYQRMLNDREIACDDAVIAAGMLSSDYASHLLEIGAGSPANRPPLMASTMARSNAVEGRIMTILEPGTCRHRLRPSTGWLVTLVGLFAAGLIGSLQFLNAEPDSVASVGVDIAGPMTFQNAEHAGVATASEDGGSGRLHLVSLADSTIRWSIETKLPPHDRPLLSEDHVFLMTSDRTLHCYSIQDGEAQWTYETDADNEFFLDAVQENSTGSGTVILATLGGGMIALDSASGKRASEPLLDKGVPELVLERPREGSAEFTRKEIPPQYLSDYLGRKPTDFINDPQHLLPKEVRSQLTESLRSWCTIRDRNVQIMILDGNQTYPGWTIGGPSDFDIWGQYGKGHLIAYFLGNQERLLSWPNSLRIPASGNGSPAFELMRFIEQFDRPHSTDSDLMDTSLNEKGDPTFSRTKDWDVIALGGGQVVPVSRFEPGNGRHGPDQPVIPYVQAGNYTTNFISSAGATFGNLSGSVANWEEIQGEKRIVIPVFAPDFDRIAEVLVAPGDRVMPGSPLLRLMGHAAAVKIRNASIDFEAAELALESAGLDDADRQRLIRKVESSRKRLESAAAELAGKTVRSTVFGKVLDVNAIVGKSVSPLHPIVEIEKRAYLD